MSLLQRHHRSAIFALSTPSLLVLAALLLRGHAGAQTAEELLIKERSSFRQSSEVRNPFLPIGWVKPAPQEVVAKSGGAPKVDHSALLFKPERFVVSSISTGAMPLALINGKTYGEGDLIPLGEQESVQVERIRDGEVQLRFRDKTMNLTIKRSERSPGEGH